MTAAHSDQGNIVSASQATESSDAMPLSFAALSDLIASGATIPGIKDIPDVVNEQPASTPTLATQFGAGKKPWER